MECSQLGMLVCHCAKGFFYAQYFAENLFGLTACGGLHNYWAIPALGGNALHIWHNHLH